MLCWRRISAIGTPASPCFRISTIWLSVNRDFRLGISLAPESLPSKCLPEGEAYDPIAPYQVVHHFTLLDGLENFFGRRPATWPYPATGRRRAASASCSPRAAA